MKWFFFALIGLLFFFHCGSPEPTAPDQTNAPAGSYDPPQPVDLGHVETQALVRNYWVFEIVRDRNNPQNDRDKPGTWYQFNPDGTFTGGHWSQTTHQGSWRFRIQDGRAYLNVDSSDDGEDIQFELQGINADGDAMSWVSTKLYGNGGMMLKAINLLTIPTKEQFGVE
jgi:hypothetical protein